MGIKVFLDTNILLDLLDNKRLQHPSAIEIYRLAEAHEIEAFISENVIATADYILQKVASKEKRFQLLSDLLGLLEMLPCSSKICQNALSRKHTDLEDALLYHLSLEHSLDYFITGDKEVKKLSLAALPVVSAKEFLSINQ